MSRRVEIAEEGKRDPLRLASALRRVQEEKAIFEYPKSNARRRRVSFDTLIGARDRQQLEFRRDDLNFTGTAKATQALLLCSFLNMPVRQRH